MLRHQSPQTPEPDFAQWFRGMQPYMVYTRSCLCQKGLFCEHLMGCAQMANSVGMLTWSRKEVAVYALYRLRATTDLYSYLFTHPRQTHAAYIRCMPAHSRQFTRCLGHTVLSALDAAAALANTPDTRFLGHFFAWSGRLATGPRVRVHCVAPAACAFDALLMRFWCAFDALLMRF